MSEKSASTTGSGGHGKLFALSLAALGVVYGDIGTSPLYAINEIFFGHGNVKTLPENVYGSISLVLWALTIIVTLKYLVFVLRADNGGEGGVFSLYALLNAHKKKGIAFLLIMLTFTAGLLYGDGLITPAISVLSAVEGLKVAAPALEPYIVVITILILTGLFAIQNKGTSKVGRIFGPIVALWYIVLAVLGFTHVVQNPEIFQAFNPWYGISFLQHSGIHGAFLVLGSVMLAITGGEALFADMGHFGKKPIRLSWFSIVYPALLLNYLGQGAFLLSGKAVQEGNIFYSMVPHVLLVPIIILATFATVIASQALISGAFSLTSQAIALGLFPRLKISHTHHEHEGQIYLRFINWSLYVGCVLLVLGFRSSTALASAYGLAVSGDMLMTSIAMFVVATLIWKWRMWKTFLVFGAFAIVDLSFLLANSLKFFEGGFIPFSIGVLLFIMMMTWQWGRKATSAAYTQKHSMTMKELVELKNNTDQLLDRTFVLMAPKPLRLETDNTPALLQLFWERYHVLPKNLIFLDVIHNKIPYVYDDRYHVTVFQREQGKGSIVSVTVQFGFMEDPNVEAIMEELARHHQIALEEDHRKWLVHVSMEKLSPSAEITFFNRFKLKLFSFLRHLSQPAYYYYGLGNDVHLSIEVMPIKVS